MKLNIISLICICLISAANAQTVEIYSGEHEGFTRLAFRVNEVDLPVPILGDQQLLLEFSEDVELRGLESVFEQISRERISEVRHDLNEVTILLSCRCEFEFKADSSSVFYMDFRTQTPSDILVSSKETGATREGAKNLTGEFSDSLIFEDFLFLRKSLNRFENLRSFSDYNPRSLPSSVTNLTLKPSDSSWLPNLDVFSREEVDDKHRNSILVREVSSLDGYLLSSLGGFGSYDRDAEFNCENYDLFWSYNRFPSSDRFAEGVSLLRSELLDGEFNVVEERLVELILLLLGAGLAEEAYFYTSLLQDSPLLKELTFFSLILMGEYDLIEMVPPNFYCSLEGRFWVFVSGEEVSIDQGDVSKFLLYYRSLPVGLRKELNRRFFGLLSEGKLLSLGEIPLFFESDSPPNVFEAGSHLSSANSEVLEAEFADVEGTSSTKKLSLSPGFIDEIDPLIFEGVADSLSGDVRELAAKISLIEHFVELSDWPAALRILDGLMKESLFSIEAREYFNDAFIRKFLDRSQDAIFLSTIESELFLRSQTFLNEETANLLAQRVKDIITDLEGEAGFSFALQVPTQNLSVASEYQRGDSTTPEVEQLQTELDRELLSAELLLESSEAIKRDVEELEAR